MLRLYLLGAPRVEVHKKPIEVDTRKAIALLVYLVLTGKPQARDTLAALFWPDLDQSRARAALRRTLSSLRTGVGEDVIDSSREMLSLNNVLKIWSDVDEFKTLIEQVQNHPHQDIVGCVTCTHLLEQAVQSYNGDFMQGFTLRDSPSFDDWQFFEGDSLKEKYAFVLEKLASNYAHLGDFHKAIEITRRWLSIDSLREEAHRQLMLLYVWTGQRNAAFRQYQDCVRIMEEELGVEPTEETVRLYQNLLSGNVPSAPSPQELPLLETAPASLGSTPYPLIGREHELNQLLAAYKNINTTGYFIGISGETGVGKSRLTEDFISLIRSMGGQVLEARCFQGETDLAYSPFQEAVRTGLNRPGAMERIKNILPHWILEAARLLPELGEMIPTQVLDIQTESQAAQYRLFEGLHQIIKALVSGPQPGVLVLDDLQWADSSSLSLLTYLARRLKNTPLLFVGVWSQEGPVGDSSISQIITELQRSQTGRILNLKRLNLEQVGELSEIIGFPVGLQQRLFEKTEGLPFFIVEYLGALQNTQLDGDWETPPTVQELQRSRISKLDEISKQLIATAAVIGRSFDFNTLRTVSGRSEIETITGLETLVKVGMILEHQENDQGLIGFDFNHERLREVVYNDISGPRRQLLHRRVAETLHKYLRSSNHSTAPAVQGHFAQVARHYLLAGQNQLASENFKLAGDHARSLYANAEALSHYQKALDLGHPSVLEILENIGDLQTLRGEYDSAIQSFSAALEIAGESAVPGLLHKSGVLFHRRGEWSIAIENFEKALALLKDRSDPGLRAHIYADYSRTVFRMGNSEQALELAQQALNTALEAKDIAGQAQAHNILGILARGQQELTTARSHLKNALCIAQESGNFPAQMAALNNLALVYSEEDDRSSAIQMTLDALQLCNRLGDRHREAALLNNLADLYYASGDSDQAMKHLKMAVEIFAEIGLEAGELHPEIWRLTEW